MEQMQQQMSRISIIEHEITCLGSMKMMQQQIAVMFSRWEVEQKEKAETKQKTSETKKGKAH